MKVLMFGWEFPPYISGGLGTACYGLTKSMALRGNEISFVLPHFEGGKTDAPIDIIDAGNVELSRKPGIKIIENDYRLRFLEVDSLLRPYQNMSTYENDYAIYQSSGETASTKEKIPFGGFYGKNLVEEVYRLGLIGARLGETGNFDIIHAHDWMTYPAGIEARKVSGKPLIVHVHATEFDRSGENVNNIIFEIERKGMLYADRIIAVSKRTKEIIINRYGIDPYKVDVVYNAVDREEKGKIDIGRNVNEKVVLFLGRITMQKGPAFFVDAAYKVLKKIKNVRFLMAGDGDLFSSVVKKTAELRIQSHFHFTGFLNGDDIKKAFAVSDLLVMPSVSEPFGIVPMEALQHGLPVIISKQSGVSELLKDAVSVDFWDTDLLSREIIRILSDKQCCGEMLKRSSEIINEFNWDKAAGEVEKTYRKVVR